MNNKFPRQEIDKPIPKHITTIKSQFKFLLEVKAISETMANVKEAAIKDKAITSKSTNMVNAEPSTPTHIAYKI